MNIFGKTLVLLFLAAGMLASCSSQSTPTMSDAEIMETAISTVRTALAETQRAMPTATPGLLPLPTVSFRTPTPSSVPTLRPTSTPLAFTDPSIPLSERIVFYYFVNPAENPNPEGTVSGLAPTYTDETYTSDTAADLRTALEILLHDTRNYWVSHQLEIVEATFGNGHADIALQGEYFGMGDGVLCAADRQILFTVFANPSVQTATVTINGSRIGYLCPFGHPNPDGYLNDDVNTRAEIETYMNEHAYVAATATPSSVIQVEVYADQDWLDTGITIQVNDQVEIKYIAGAWSIYTPWGSVDPEGYSFAPRPLNPIPDAQPGELIGKIGQTLFRIGRQVEFTAQSEGHVYLRINDDSLEGNTGRLLVQIIVRTQ